jgi:hypothetical protein
MNERNGNLKKEDHLRALRTNMTIYRMMRPRGQSLAGRVEHEKKSKQDTAGKGKRPLGIFIIGWEENLKMDHR